MSFPVSQNLIPFKEIARHFCVSVRTVRNWHVLGVLHDETGDSVKLEAVRPGGKYLTTWQAVKAFIERRAAAKTLSEVSDEDKQRDVISNCKIDAFVS